MARIVLSPQGGGAAADSKVASYTLDFANPTSSRTNQYAVVSATGTTYTINDAQQATTPSTCNGLCWALTGHTWADIAAIWLEADVAGAGDDAADADARFGFAISDQQLVDADQYGSGFQLDSGPLDRFLINGDATINPAVENNVATGQRCTWLWMLDSDGTNARLMFHNSSAERTGGSEIPTVQDQGPNLLTLTALATPVLNFVCGRSVASPTNTNGGVALSNVSLRLLLRT